MDPVARVWDVLDVSVWEQPLDFWVIFRAVTQGGSSEHVRSNTAGVFTWYMYMYQNLYLHSHSRHGFYITMNIREY